MAGLAQLAGRFFRGPAAKEALKASIPGAALNLGLGTLMGGPVEGLAYAAGDLALNYPALRIARKLAPGVEQEIKDVATGKITKHYAPSALEQGTNLVASLGSGALVNSLLTPNQQAEISAQDFLAQQAQQVNPGLQPQSQQVSQQVEQRSILNRLPTLQQALASNTQFQMQGIEQTASNFHYPGLTIPPELLAQLQEGGMG